jgi:hypothetical protein
MKVLRSKIRKSKVTIGTTRMLASTYLVTFSLSSCKSELRVSTSAGKGTSNITNVVPPFAKADDTLTISGKNFAVGETYKAIYKKSVTDSVEVIVTAKSADSATLSFPKSIDYGLVSFEVLSGTKSMGTFNVVSLNNTEMFYYDGDAADICSSKAYLDASGTKKSGTQDCHELSNCTADGQVDCKTTDTYKAGNTALITAGNFKSDLSLAGTAGKIQTCTAYGVQGCVTTSSYVSAAVGNAWDIRRGTSVGSTTGQLLTNCRNGTQISFFDQSDIPKPAVVDMTTDTITINSHGWSDNQKIRLSYTSPPTGLGQATTYYVVNSTPNTFQVSATLGGGAIDITNNGGNVFFFGFGDGVAQYWDTIDDYNASANVAPSYTGWSSNLHICGGVESTADDDNVWKDVTTTGDGVASSTCSASAANCSLKDKISQLEWHKADLTARDWAAALSLCDGLTYNGKSDWRLPTQKELVAANTDGIATTLSTPNWMTFSGFYWTSTTPLQNGSQYAVAVELVSGRNTYSGKWGLSNVICTRP